jgi:hypothetical protein
VSEQEDRRAIDAVVSAFAWEDARPGLEIRPQAVAVE